MDSSLKLFKFTRRRSYGTPNDVTTTYYKPMEIKESPILLIDKTIMIPPVEKRQGPLTHKKEFTVMKTTFKPRIDLDCVTCWLTKASSTCWKIWCILHLCEVISSQVQLREVYKPQNLSSCPRIHNLINAGIYLLTEGCA